MLRAVVVVTVVEVDGQDCYVTRIQDLREHHAAREGVRVEEATGAELQQDQAALLEAVVRGQPLADTLEEVTRLAERSLPGAFAALYVVDPTGRVRAESWRPIASSHPEYLAALRAHVPSMRYAPARLDGQPVCQLVRNQVRFDWAGPMPTVTLSN